MYRFQTTLSSVVRKGKSAQLKWSSSQQIARDQLHGIGWNVGLQLTAGGLLQNPQRLHQVCQ